MEKYWLVNGLDYIRLKCWVKKGGIITTTTDDGLRMEKSFMPIEKAYEYVSNT